MCTRAAICGLYEKELTQAIELVSDDPVRARLDDLGVCATLEGDDLEQVLPSAEEVLAEADAGGDAGGEGGGEAGDEGGDDEGGGRDGDEGGGGASSGEANGGEAEGGEPCCVCGGTHNPPTMVPCAFCARWYHEDCHVPPLGREAFEGDWFCADCVEEHGLPERHGAHASSSEEDATDEEEEEDEGESDEDGFPCSLGCGRILPRGYSSQDCGVCIRENAGAAIFRGGRV